MRVGRVLEVLDFPAARKPAYQLLIDFGPLGQRRSSAQLTTRYSKAELVGRMVIAVVNFPPRRIAGFSSGPIASVGGEKISSKKLGACPPCPVTCVRTSRRQARSHFSSTRSIRP